MLKFSSFFIKVGILPPRSGFRLRSTPRSVFRLRFFARKPITGPAPEVRQRGCPRSIADRVFFHHSHAQPSILAWQQDCFTQSCVGRRIASLNPVLGTGLPGVFRKTLEAHCCIAGQCRKTLEARRYTATRSRTRRPDCPKKTVSAGWYTATR